MRKIILFITVLSLSFAAVAVAAPARNTTGTVYAGVTHAEGDDLYVSGDFKDSVLGRGAIVYLTQPDVTPTGSVLVKARQITIYTSKGSLRGSGEATQTGDIVTDGTFSLTKGKGAYKGKSFSGTFEGTFADGVYTFTYKGRLK